MYLEHNKIGRNIKKPENVYRLCLAIFNYGPRREKRRAEVFVYGVVHMFID